MRCPDIWSIIIVGISIKMFLYDFNIWIHRSSKADCLAQCELASSNQLKIWIEQKCRIRWNSSCLTTWNWDISLQLMSIALYRMVPDKCSCLHMPINRFQLWYLCCLKRTSVNAGFAYSYNKWLSPLFSFWYSENILFYPWMFFGSLQHLYFNILA